jgi:hypothetical protein
VLSGDRSDGAPATSTGPSAPAQDTGSDIARLPDPTSGSSPDGPGSFVRPIMGSRCGRCKMSSLIEMAARVVNRVLFSGSSPRRPLKLSPKAVLYVMSSWRSSSLPLTLPQGAVSYCINPNLIDRWSLCG